MMRYSRGETTSMAAIVRDYTVDGTAGARRDRSGLDPERAIADRHREGDERALVRAGFIELRQRGSHRIFAFGTRRAILPMHRRRSKTWNAQDHPRRGGRMTKTPYGVRVNTVPGC
jgi:predicted NUDIX family NTP pyrophosphohydrolase